MYIYVMYYVAQQHIYNNIINENKENYIYIYNNPSY